MTPADLEGARFGPVDVDLTPAHVAAYVAATHDDPARWSAAAPPGFAAVLLFAVAGGFLWDERIADHTRTLLHLDQAFTYHTALPVGMQLSVTGEVTRVRQRARAHFVTFEATAVRGADVVVESRSTFLMSAASSGDPGPDPGEPPATARAENVVAPRHALEVGEMPPLAKSASRADLIQYGAATADHNPIHWDHEAARAGGAPGVIVHGLLMMAWAIQQVVSIGADADPLETIKLRFRNPLRPAEQAIVSCVVGDVAADARHASVAVTVARGDETLVTGAAAVRTAG